VPNEQSQDLSFKSMPQFLATLIRGLRNRGADMKPLCHQLLSHRGEVKQVALAQRIIELYGGMDSNQQLAFFEMLARDFGPDEPALKRALEEYREVANPARASALFAAIEPLRQELFRRINTAPAGTENLLAMRADLLRLLRRCPNLRVLDTDLKHLFKSWFNPGFLRLERIGWHTPARVLEKLIRYEAVHEINGWPDLRRRLEADRRCFAFFHPALSEEPIIFLEVALTRGLALKLDPLLDICAPVLPVEQANTAVFYSINNCLDGLRGIPLGSFLIKQVVDELSAELPRIRCYSTISPLPGFAHALHDQQDQNGFTRERLSRLLGDFAGELTARAGNSDPIDALFLLLKDPVACSKVLSPPLHRLALVYLTRLRADGKPYDPVARFHFANGARLELIDTFANRRPYGLQQSYGVMVNYRYISWELERNHERFVQGGDMRISSRLRHDHEAAGRLWRGELPQRVRRSDAEVLHH
jgi:malonyl-CoA decarboxylase